MERIKRITSHAGHARFLAEVDFGVGRIPRQQDIPSPYASGPEHTVHRWKMNYVFVVETKHKQYDVFGVPAHVQVLPLEK